MDFFERQHQAQKKTKWLVFYLVLAVALIITAVYLAVVVVFVGARKDFDFAFAWWQPDLFFYVTLGTLLVIGGGTLFKVMELAQGGRILAESLGGRRLDPHTAQPAEKRLLNVVEEMAVAAGLPVPAVYLLHEEPGINAFAAGMANTDAVIGVTRGCLERLNRDELQGVIAHEFSHVLHGDMRQNLRLIGLLNGILCLALIGRILLRTRGRRNPLPLLGLALLVVGSIGVFFGRLIKSAIARQREFLADASAVQFTRNPEGIAGALKKIGGWGEGSKLRAANAEEASHLFFSNGLSEAWLRLFATHPPLAERIRAIDPNFTGVFPAVEGGAPAPAFDEELVAELAPAVGEPPAIRPDHLVAQPGQFSQQHLAHAAALIASLPPAVARASQEPRGATHVIYALLLSPDQPTRTEQMKLLQTSVGPSAQEVPDLAACIKDLRAQTQLLLVDRTLPALRSLSRDRYQQFLQIVQALVECDRTIDLFEYTLQRILRRHLAPAFDKPTPSVVRYHDLRPVVNDCAILLSALARLGQEEPERRERAFRQGVSQLNLYHVPLHLLEAEECNLVQIDAALERLNQVTPLHKRNILYACAHTVAADGVIRENEAELLRAMADSLDCPMPPFLENLEERLPDRSDPG